MSYKELHIVELFICKDRSYIYYKTGEIWYLKKSLLNQLINEYRTMGGDEMAQAVRTLGTY